VKVKEVKEQIELKGAKEKRNTVEEEVINAYAKALMED
jgi:hypothetical protein